MCSFLCVCVILLLLLLLYVTLFIFVLEKSRCFFSWEIAGNWVSAEVWHNYNVTKPRMCLAASLASCNHKYTYTYPDNTRLLYAFHGGYMASHDVYTWFNSGLMVEVEGWVVSWRQPLECRREQWCKWGMTVHVTVCFYCQPWWIEENVIYLQVYWWIKCIDEYMLCCSKGVN